MTPLTFPVRWALALLRCYWAVSGAFAPRCRFVPSCSRYAAEALQTHGLLRGSFLAVKRLLSCHPLGPSGIDPVPHR